MARQLNETIELLHEVHKELLLLAEEKSSVIIRGEFSRLQEIVREETKLVSRASELENLRIDAAKAVLNNQAEVENPAVEDLLPHLTDSEAETLRHLRERLLETIRELQERNRRNDELLEDSLRLVNMTLEAAVPRRHSGHYSNRGKEQAGVAERVLFDSRA
ncbi:flagellar protein FlgN [Alteribacter natronophilus]|uniref:flagellar protein FlgN n=1 Tax=Alteribacter natronophilus TaxID=2583810 RepID=UPI00148641E9|nr:flagellar protein FlgN [Alteribacter natronophilus]